MIYIHIYKKETIYPFVFCVIAIVLSNCCAASYNIKKIFCSLPMNNFLPLIFLPFLPFVL